MPSEDFSANLIGIPETRALQELIFTIPFLVNGQIRAVSKHKQCEARTGREHK